MRVLFCFGDTRSGHVRTCSEAMPHGGTRGGAGPQLGVLRRELQELAKQLGLVEDRAARDRTRIEEQHAAWAEQA